MRGLTSRGVRAVAVAAASGVLVVGLAAFAQATGTPDGDVHADESGATGTLTSYNSSSEPADEGGTTTQVATGPPPRCQWYAYPGKTLDPPEGEKGGQWYARYCDNPHFDGLQDFLNETGGWEWMSGVRQHLYQQTGFDLEYSIAPPDQPTPLQRLEQEIAAIPFPDSRIAVNPRAAMQLVSVPTWVWLTDDGGGMDPALYEPRFETLTADGYTLTFSVVPTLTVEPGDGTTVDCEAPGTPWSESADESRACTHTYARAGQYTLATQVYWQVTWSVNGVEQEPIDGPTMTDEIQVDVHESQAVVTEVR